MNTLKKIKSFSDTMLDLVRAAGLHFNFTPTEIVLGSKKVHMTAKRLVSHIAITDFNHDEIKVCNYFSHHRGNIPRKKFIADVAKSVAEYPADLEAIRRLM